MELLTSDATVANLLMNCTNQPVFSPDYEARRYSRKGIGKRHRRGTQANPYSSKADMSRIEI